MVKLATEADLAQLDLDPRYRGWRLTTTYNLPDAARVVTASADGTAAVCTMTGEVWLVRGLDANLKNIRWKRFATGLHQPLGVRILEGRLYVLGRDQVDPRVPGLCVGRERQVGVESDNRYFEHAERLATGRRGA